MKRSVFVRVAVALSVAIVGLSIMGCLGQRAFFAGRPFPPSTILQRVLVSIQNPSPLSQGAMQIIDARYDIRNSEDGKIPSFFISGYVGKLPTSIINYPEQQSGFAYGYGDGVVAAINYSTEKQTNAIKGFTTNLPYNSVFVTEDGRYGFAANQPGQVLTVIDSVVGINVNLNLPNVYKVAVNPGGTVVLAFVQDSDYAYRVIHLQQPNGTIAPVPTFPNEVNWPSIVRPVDCKPVTTPLYCVVPVLDQAGNPIKFDRPTNAIFSSDGTTAWLLNCGPECGNTAVDPVTGQATASVSFLSTGVLNIYNFPGTSYAQYPTPVPPSTTPPPMSAETLPRVPIPGGATMALYGNGNLYVSGQQLMTAGPYAGLLGGFLSVLNLGTLQVTNQYQIADGTHTKMLFGDDNTMWIGSQACQTGVLTAQNNSAMPNGCLTMFNMNNNTVLVEPWYGDLTGLCVITQWHKVYTAYGGQLHIYATTNTGITTITSSSLPPNYQAGTELYNTYATVSGTAYDVAYMDAITNAAD